MKKFTSNTVGTGRAWFLIGALVLQMISTVGCSRYKLEEVHGFSNVVLDKGILWFGAGYKLYVVDTKEPIARLLYDTNDVVVSFVQIDGRRLFFGGHHSPNGSTGVIWSLD